MHIDAICNYNCNCNTKPSFQKLIIDKTAVPIINKLPKNDIVEFSNIRKKVSRYKYWD